MNDPYAFPPTFGELDQHLFHRGVHYELYKVMGARLMTHCGVSGVAFTVWAPSAKSVSVVGDFNHWDGRCHPMRSMGFSGVFELFIPGITSGERYKFEVISQTGELIIKADPFALASELRPANASVVADVFHFPWKDEKRKERPMLIYELHVGSWRGFRNYRELAHDLAAYCNDMGFTYVELMPIMEHPLDESWGYQVSGFYAVTSRFGTPEDFQYFVNHLHEKNIGIILDWVPGHFPTDKFALSRFDGTALYEHEDPRQGFHPHWSTLIFNYGRHEVTNFLIANALFWLEVMHVDGLRVDAVASMLYLDYGRNEGEWIPNRYGGRENLEAIEFLKHLNAIVHERCPGALMIAEESTSFPGVTRPVSFGGLGFDLKWNMGWMNDTLRYFSKDPIFREHHHQDLTFGLLYAFSERFLLPFSHDEVVHGKSSMLGKMPGDLWQKFANLRLLLSYQICQPGKKLLFMGAEIGQWTEWHCKGECDWNLLQYPAHKGIQSLVRDLNHLYMEQKELQGDAFQWVDFSDAKNSVISYLRGHLLCVHNFTPQHFSEYIVRLPEGTTLSERFNSDAEKYDGSGKINKGIIRDNKITLAPLSTMIFEVLI